MDTTQIMIVGFGSLVSGLFTVVWYFFKRIMKQLDKSQTTTGCAQLIKSCHDVREANKETFTLERTTLAKELHELIEGFDELCKCLTRYTEGKCP